MARCRRFWVLPESLSLLALASWGVFLGYTAQTGLFSGNGAWERLWAVTVGMAALYLFLGWVALRPDYFAEKRLSKLPDSAQASGQRAIRFAVCAWKACLLWGWTGSFWLRSWGTGLEGWLWLLLGLVAAGVLVRFLAPLYCWIRRGKPEDEIWH